MPLGRTLDPADAVANRLEDASSKCLVRGMELFVREQVVEGVERSGEVARHRGVGLVGVRLGEVEERNRRDVAGLCEGVGVGLKSSRSWAGSVRFLTGAFSLSSSSSEYMTR